jgi:peptidoglycan/LPS O-acetylase OafA/YrhL
MFYFLGIILVKNREIIPQLKKNKNLLINGSISAIALVVFFLQGSKFSIDKNTYQFDFVFMLSSVISSYFLCYFFIGIASRLANFKLKIIQYISKSSYFLYLIHFPFLIIFILIFHHVNLPIFLHFSILLSLTLLASFGANYIWRKLWKDQPPI